MIVLLAISGFAAVAAIALHGVADSRRRRRNRPPLDLTEATSAPPSRQATRSLPPLRLRPL